MVKRILILVATLIAVAASSAMAAKPDLNLRELKVETGDGLTLYGWLTPSTDGRPSPLLVLLPMLGHTHTSYDSLITALYARTEEIGLDREWTIPTILSMDLRGHGKSTEKQDTTLDYQTLSKGDFVRYPTDVAAMIMRVLADKSLLVDREKIIIVGASIGANTSVIVTDLIPNITKVAMLSPGGNYRSLMPAASIERFGGKILIMVGDEDEYSWQSSTDFANLKEEGVRLIVYPSRDHGTRIPNNNPDAMDELINWLIE